MTAPEPDEPTMKLIRNAAQPATVMPPELFAKLRADSAAAFAQSFTATPSSSRSRFMIHLPKLVAGLAASLLVAVGAVWLLQPDPAVEVKPADVALTASPGTLVYEYRDSASAAPQSIFVRQGAAPRLRWSVTDLTYRLVAATTMYVVEEERNRYTTSEVEYFDAVGAFQPWAVLGLPAPPQAMSGRFSYVTAEVAPRRVEVTATADGVPERIETYTMPANGASVLLASLVLVSQGKDVPEDKFLLKATLSEDGRVGKIADVQGIAGVKPVNAERFTPLRPNVLVLPGDLLRVDLRGANAVTVKLLPQADLVAGPGTLVEILKPTQIRLMQGEIELAPSKGTPIELLAGKDQKFAVAERGFYRMLPSGEVQKIGTEPVWLKSLKGASTNESLGALVAQVDGRAVNLTVGVHNVSVEIRDQIARTTIEETFVNHTDSQLEGVFQFPLPADASIAGFAMWIGNEMVEADVVEKQRAREIFETILREKRDPGLLEWSGGNLFKARVFPIFPRSDKRIRIVYTQVLPAQGNKVRYSYALQSEMLRQNPLKSLAIDVKVNSAKPMKTLTSPSHTGRTTQGVNAARFEFTAQEYTPTKDFEAVIELAENASPITVIPHRRGSDGYFLVQVTPPAPAGGGERSLVGEGKPIPLVLWCDTSLSVDRGMRNLQAAFAAAMLNALTPKDTFNLVTADVDAVGAFDAPKPATAENIGAALDFLNRRTSLGWTNLDKAFDAILKQSAPGTTVVYLGDGISTTGNANPQEAAARLVAKHAASTAKPTVHAVALGSAFESVVMKALGTMNGGSTRRLTQEQGPAAAALEILTEITKPPVRDVVVTFPGWKTAKVYPETLPNLVPGTQQILVGRYLPEGKEQRGEVVVVGKQNGVEVRFSASVSLADAESGNSFLPRLWARSHLDKLLEAKQTPALKEEIVGFSEEFHIMTPYTSFLVLESDADRERFKVTRKFQMRDGEQFFADAKANVAYELGRDQSRKAGLYRAGLRRETLAQLGGLGRAPLMSPQDRREDQLQEYESLSAGAGFGGGGGGFGGGFGGGENLLRFSGQAGATNSRQIFTFGLFKASGDGGEAFYMDSAKSPGVVPTAGALGNPELGLELDLPTDDTGKPAPADSIAKGEAGAKDLDEWDARFGVELQLEAKKLPALKQMADGRGGIARDEYMRRSSDRYRGLSDAGLVFLQAGPMGRSYMPRPYDQIDALFPYLVPSIKPAKPKPSTWPKAALDLATLVHRRPKFSDVGVLRELTLETADGVGRGASIDRRTELLSKDRWLTRNVPEATTSTVEWVNETERGTYVTHMLLGRIRKATAEDKAFAPLDNSDYGAVPLNETYGYLNATVAAEGKLQVLVLKHAVYKYELRFFIDVEKKVVVKVTSPYDGTEKPADTELTDFVQVAGQWWPKSIVSTNDGKVTRKATIAVTEIPAADVAAKLTALLPERKQVIFQTMPHRTISQARTALAAGKAATDDQWAILRDAVAFQMWNNAVVPFKALEAAEGEKPGFAWIRIAYQLQTRRNEEARVRMLARAEDLAGAKPTGDTLALAHHLRHYAGNVLSPAEQLTVYDRLTPLVAALRKELPFRREWLAYRYQLLVQNNRLAEAKAELLQQLDADPRSFAVVTQLLQHLRQYGERTAAETFVRKLIAEQPAWEPNHVEYFRSLFSDWLEADFRYADKRGHVEGWLKANPKSEPAAWQYLSILVRTDAGEQADKLAREWLNDFATAEKSTPEQTAKFRAAARFLMGEGQGLNSRRIEDRSVAPLTAAARTLVFHPTRYDEVEVILDSNAFHNLAESRALNRELFARFLADAAEMPRKKLTWYLAWSLRKPIDVSTAEWVKLLGALKARWIAVADDELKHSLGEQLVQLIRIRQGRPESRAFLRERLAAAPESRKVAYRYDLYREVTGSEWTASLVDEGFALWPQLHQGDKPPTAEHVNELMALVDWAEQSRIAHLEGELKETEKMTRPELAAAKAKLAKKARAEVIERLVKLEGIAKSAAAWIALERLTLEARNEADVNVVAASAAALLPTPPVFREAKDDDEVAPDDEHSKDLLASQFASRVVQLRLWCATRKAAKPETIDALVKFLDAGLAAAPKVPAWKYFKRMLLIALDRPAELEAALRAWSKDDDDASYRTALGYLLAELGRLREAAALFSSITQTDAQAYARKQSLAAWYLALDDRAAHEAAKRDSFRQLPENQLYQMLSIKQQLWVPQPGRALPTSLDDETLLITAVLIEKTNQPQNYLYMIAQLYRMSKDFRLPATVVESVVGQSAGKIYATLEGMMSVIAEVRDEAAADGLIAKIESTRAKAKTATDERALDLLGMQVRRRAAEVKNQPGSHIEAALGLFRRAFDRPFAEAERRLMSNLLARFGRITPDELGREQLRQLKELAGAAPAGSREKLETTYDWASIVNQTTGAKDALAILQPEVEAFLKANGGKWPMEAQGLATQILDYYRNAGEWKAGEAWIATLAKAPVNDEAAKVWRRVRFDYRLQALEQNGDLADGKGVVLYDSLLKELLADLASSEDVNESANLFQTLARLYRSGSSKQVARVKADVTEFAKVTYPKLAPLVRMQAAPPGSVGLLVRDFIGPVEAIEFVLDQLDREPKWLILNNADGWPQYSGLLAQWHRDHNATPLALNKPLEARLLKFVLAELRHDLRYRQTRQNGFYWSRHHHYWPEKESEFAVVAEEFVKLHAESKDHEGLLYAVNYLFHGCNRRGRAIDLLTAEYDAGRLNFSEKMRLAGYQHETGAYAASIPILVKLVAEAPTNLQPRLTLMTAYERTNRRRDLTELFARTIAEWKAAKTWDEGTINTLSIAADATQLNAENDALLSELIPRVQRSGGAANQLAEYYRRHAECLKRLGKTVEAVDAAGGAIVAWGGNVDQRRVAIEQLNSVLREAANLDAVVAAQDKLTAETKLVNPIVRLALGRAYHAKQNYAKAATQLELAYEAQPNDPESQTLLVESYDKLNRKQDALAQLLKAVDYDRRDLNRLEALASRYVDLGRPADAERAYTSYVEAMPNEAEGHRKLAELRQKQDRWLEALPHWEEINNIRSLEPDGLLGLAAAQLHLNRKDDAAKTIAALRAKTWPNVGPDFALKLRDLEAKLK